MFYGSLTNGSIAAAQLNHLYFSVITVRESGTNSCQVGTVLLFNGSMVADFPSLLIHGLSSAQCSLCGCSGLIVFDPTIMHIMYFRRVWHRLYNIRHLDVHVLVL